MLYTARPHAMHNRSKHDNREPKHSFTSLARQEKIHVKVQKKLFGGNSKARGGQTLGRI